MTNGYAVQFLDQGVELSAALESAAPFVTKALFLFPIGSALFQLVQGFLADHWGRKPAAITMSACTLVTYLLFSSGPITTGIPTWWGSCAVRPWAAIGHQATLLVQLWRPNPRRLICVPPY